MTFPSPENLDGVASVIEKTEGMAKTEMKVKYKEGTHGNKKTGKIKDHEISDISNIEVVGDLDNAYEQIGNIKNEITAMNVESNNNIIEYQKFVNRIIKR